MDFIGLNDIKDILTQMTKQGDVYRKGRVTIPHMIIMMDPGNGQTYTTETITDILSTYHLRDFHGLDEYLEYKLDGSKSNLEWVFSDIKDNAIYENYYKGVVSIDVSQLAKVLNEYQMKYFEENIKKVSEHATVILYCSTKLGVKGDKLVERLKDVLHPVRVIPAHIYTNDEYVQIIINNIMDRGIEISNKERMIRKLENIVSAREITSVKDALRLAEELVYHADYSKDIPVLNDDAIKGEL